MLKQTSFIGISLLTFMALLILVTATTHAQTPPEGELDCAWLLSTPTNKNTKRALLTNRVTPRGFGLTPYATATATWSWDKNPECEGVYITREDRIILTLRTWGSNKIARTHLNVSAGDSSFTCTAIVSTAQQKTLRCQTSSDYFTNITDVQVRMSVDLEGSSCAGGFVASGVSGTILGRMGSLRGKYSVCPRMQ